MDHTQAHPGQTTTQATLSSRPAGGGHAALAHLLALVSLTACATPPAKEPPAPPDLAAVLAPETPRPAMIAPLTALLRGERSDLLLTLGDETVRCEVSIEHARSAATCDGFAEEAPTVAELVKKLHTGDWQRRRLLAHLGDRDRFVERTGLVLTPNNMVERDPFGPSELTYPLGNLLGWTRIEVSERGETLRASFRSFEGPETIEAGSLLVLGQRLREREAELLAEQSRRAIQDRDRTVLGFLLGHLSTPSQDRWQLDHVVVGQTRLGQLASIDTKLRLVAPDDPFWQVNLNVRALATERAPGASARSLPLTSVVVQAAIFTSRETPGETYCAKHDEWLSRQKTPFTRGEAPTPTGCRWSWSSDSHRIDLELTTTQRRLSVTWQPVRFDQSAHTAIVLEPQYRPARPHKGPRYIDP